MTTSENADGSLLDLPAAVAERVVAELSDRGEKAVAAMRTAAVLIRQAVHDETGLRFAESAAYNLREALDAVVAGRTPVPGGLPVVIEGWQRFEHETAQPGNDDALSLDTFAAVLASAAERQDRNSYREAKLLGYLRDQAGVEPLFGGLSPTAEYKRLHTTASQGLHRDTALDVATTLYQDTLAWFVRMFTPPDAIVMTLRRLAAEPWQGPEQINRLREWASNPHHLRLFFARLVDPAWLDPLYNAGVVLLPTAETPWPVAGLMEELGRTTPAPVAALLQRLFEDSRNLRVEQRLDARFPLLILAAKLGPDGYTLIGDVATAHQGSKAVRSLAVAAVKRADPTDPIVQRVSDTVLNGGPWDHDDYYYRLVLDRLDIGMTPENTEGRILMVAAKLRRAARQHDAGWIAVGIARLTSDLSEDDRYFLIVTSHYLAWMVARAHSFGVPSRRLMECVTTIPGEVGERLTCRVLASADDIALQDKIDHITRRLASQTATGDDQDLVEVVLAGVQASAELTVWADALGSPSLAPADTAELPRDWAKAWRWSAILPEHVLAHWQEQIALVSAQHGSLDYQTFDRRISAFSAVWGQSPYSAEELTSLAVLDAARLVADWRPGSDSDQRAVGVLELARALQGVVAADPHQWAADPVAVVEILREPVHVLHYFRGLTDKVADLIPRTERIIDAARLVKAERWSPAALAADDFDFEPDWRGVDAAIVNLIGVLADHDAPFAEHLEICWTWALADLDARTDTDDIPISDPLLRATSGTNAQGLSVVLSLADWEHRKTTVIRPQFLDALELVVRVTGPVGMEFRAVLASQRPRLELIALDWLDGRVDTLFRDGDVGLATVDLTLRYCRPTTWLYLTLRDDIIAAALRGADHAVACLLRGILEGEAGYDIDEIITPLRKEPAVLARAAEDMALLVQGSSTDAPELTKAVEFWRYLVDTDRNGMPVDVLRCTGRWAFVIGVPDSVWTTMMVGTLILTNGTIDYATEVADRCETAPITSGSCTILLLLLQGRSEHWERHHIAQVALTVLRAMSADGADEKFLALRTRLVELGHDEAADFLPQEDPS